MWFLPYITKKPVIEQSYSHYWQDLFNNLHRPINISADIRSFTACGFVHPIHMHVFEMTGV